MMGPLSVNQYLCMLRMYIKRTFAYRTGFIALIIIGCILGCVCRFADLDLLLAVGVLSLLSVFITLRQTYMDRASGFTDCLLASGVTKSVKIVSSFISWLVLCVILGLFTIAVARL